MKSVERENGKEFMTGETQTGTGKGHDPVVEPRKEVGKLGNEDTEVSAVSSRRTEWRGAPRRWEL